MNAGGDLFTVGRLHRTVKMLVIICMIQICRKRIVYTSKFIAQPDRFYHEPNRSELR